MRCCCIDIGIFAACRYIAWTCALSLWSFSFSRCSGVRPCSSTLRCVHRVFVLLEQPIFVWSNVYVYARKHKSRMKTSLCYTQYVLVASVHLRPFSQASISKSISTIITTITTTASLDDFGWEECSHLVNAKRLYPYFPRSGHGGVENALSSAATCHAAANKFHVNCHG
jgi:hypothetical protein